MPTTAAPVLVVGAGPTGLTAAHRVARHGVPVRIVDAAAGPTRTSNALVVWRRSLQVLDATIPVDRFLAEGHVARRAILHTRGEPLASLGLEESDHLLPAGIFIPQSRTESILNDALARQSVSVEWSTRLVSAEPQADGVDCVLDGPHGEERVRGAWLLGCDGAHSTVRRLLGVPFPGEAVDRRWVLGDVTIDTPTPPNDALIHGSPLGAVAMFPLDASRWRVIADDGPVAADAPRRAPTTAELQSILDERTSTGWTIRATHWESDFRINERQVERYVHGRVVLAGDAAHVHSPAGGQGMNTGLQDAANLAWKVALVQRGGAAEQLVETYQEERHPIGAEVVRASGRMLRAMMITTPVIRHLRDLVVHLGLEIPAVRREVRDFLTEESISLRRSSLTGPGASRADCRPGDAWPDAPIADVDDAGGSPGAATDLLRGAEASVVVVDGTPAEDLPTRLGHGDRGFPLRRTTLRDRDLADRLGLAEGGVAVVRPDGVIACTLTDPGAVEATLEALIPA